MTSRNVCLYAVVMLLGAATLACRPKTPTVVSQSQAESPVQVDAHATDPHATDPRVNHASTAKAEATQSVATNQSTTAASGQREHYVAKPFAIPAVKNPGYVGFQACRQCHTERVAECENSSHFQTCRVPTLQRIPEAFKSSDASERTLALPGTDISFVMSIQGDKFLQTAVQKSTGSRTESTIDLIYGAKPTSDEVYLSWHADDSMWELPAAWLYSHNCWGAAGFDRTQGTDFARELTVRCFECHNTWFEHVPGTLSTYRREGLLPGVTCERCHGPGQEHTNYHLTHPQATKSQAIVFPGGLPREQLIDVCVQCHSNSIRHKGPALSFRPGESLADHYRFVTPKYSEDDHVADQITRLRQSQCFQNSQMTCITCHDPHLTSAAPHGQTFQASCVQCHTLSACKERERLPASVADKCVECHMRKFVKVNVNFDTAHDAYVPPVQRSRHDIGIDPAATREVLLSWYRSQTDAESQAKVVQLQQELVEHWTSKAEELSAAGRFTAASAAVRELLRIAPDSTSGQQQLQQTTRRQREFDDLLNSAEHARRTGRDQESIQLYSQVLKVRPDSAKALGRLGAIYSKLGDRVRAESFLSRVVEADPDDQYGLSMMAWLAMNNGEFARAAGLYEQADAIEPYNSKLNLLWGSALAKAGRLPDAAKRLEVACASDPRNLPAVRELVQVQLALQNLDAASAWALQAAQLTEHQSVPDMMILAECYLSQNNRTFATDIATLAHQVATQQNPALASQIRQWASGHGISF